MALTEFQRTICRLIAAERLRSGESYIAGAVPLNVFTAASRISRDIDLFHDTSEAVEASWNADRDLLETNRYLLKVHSERTGFVEAEVSKHDESVIMQWTADSAFRFFPLMEHAHPFDLATNKVLALVGRLEARDWVDVIGCHEKIQRLGYLTWAASGKDPGFSPQSILEQAGRSARYSAEEISALSFAGSPPDAGELSRRWHAMLNEAHELVAALPPVEVGKCVLDSGGQLFNGDTAYLHDALSRTEVRFHQGSIRGALPHPRR